MGRGPDQQLVTFYMDRSAARRFLVVANGLGLSRSELLRRMIANFDAVETEQADG